MIIEIKNPNRPNNKKSDDGFFIKLYVGMNADNKIVGIESSIANRNDSILDIPKNLPPV